MAVVVVVVFVFVFDCDCDCDCGCRCGVFFTHIGGLLSCGHWVAFSKAGCSKMHVWAFWPSCEMFRVFVLTRFTDAGDDAPSRKEISPRASAAMTTNER